MKLTCEKTKFIVVIFILCFYSCLLHAQNRNVTGTVMDEHNEPIAGAMIIVEGEENMGTVTDIDGKFTISIPKRIKTLKVSFIGMKTEFIDLTTSSVYHVILKEDATTLEEVVVVGYDVQKKMSVVGAVQNMEKAKLIQPARTLSTALAGNLAGVVSIQGSGEPGRDGASFWIRGINTFGGGSSPLVLIDGIERDLDSIEPEDIESLSILKDATATAVYGVRGGNGVVLVTTRKGVKGKPRIELKAETGFTSNVNEPEFVDAPTYMKLQNEALINMGQAPLFTDKQILNTENNVDPYYYPNVNWYKELIRKNVSSSHVTLNVNGGNDFATYYISGSFFTQNGIYKNFKENSYNNNIRLDRYIFRANADVNITKTTNVNINVESLSQRRNAPREPTDQIFNHIMDTPPTWFAMRYPDPTKIPGIPYGQGRNPYQMLAHSGYSNEGNNNVHSNFTLNQKLDFLLEGLSIRYLFSYDYNSNDWIHRETRPRPYQIVPWGFDENGEPILKDENGNYNYFDKTPDDASGDSYYDYLKIAGSGTGSNRKMYHEFNIKYAHDFGKHSVGTLFLFNANEYTYPSSNVYDAVPSRYMGLTGRVTYAYDNRYFLEYNFGYNGSENFAKGKRFGFFPSYALGWVLTKENFMNFITPYVSMIKLRGSYGKVGNDRIGTRFGYLSRIEEIGVYSTFGVNGDGYGSGTGVGYTYYGNPDATWETAEKMNVGIDLEFPIGISIQADFFKERRSGIWTTLDRIPDMFGYEKKTQSNIGIVDNKGFDAVIDYSFQTSDPRWKINLKGTFTYAKNKLIQHGEVEPRYAYQSKIGKQLNVNWGYKSIGLFVDQADIDNSPSQEYFGVVNPGDVKYEDVNHDGRIDNYDVVDLGSVSVPNIVAGLGGTILYKNFDLSFLFQGVTQVEFMAAPKTFPEINKRQVWKIVAEDRWDPIHQNVDARFPRLGVGNQTNNYQNSTRWLHDGSYLRLKNIEFGYSFDNKLVAKIGLNSLRLYVNGINLFTLSPFKWWDPESRSYEGMNYPLQKVLNVGFKLGF